MGGTFGRSEGRRHFSWNIFEMAGTSSNVRIGTLVC